MGRARDAEFEPVYHHYGPHRAGLPPLIPYFRELWRRRAFAAEMSKATMRGANTSTFFGQAWLVLNPLLLAAVYYILVTIIRRQNDPAFFAHLTLGMFAFQLVGHLDHQRGDLGDQLWQVAAEYALSAAADSVVCGAYGVLPLPAHRAGLLRLPRDLPDPCVVARRCCCPCTFLATMIVFGMGLAAFFAALQVYFRDTSSFLPFFVRIWMYLSPILWAPEHIIGRFSGPIMTLIQLNPMYSMIGGYTELLQNDAFPPPYMWISAAVWALAAAVIGFLYFISREREFAVRLV